MRRARLLALRLAAALVRVLRRPDPNLTETGKGGPRSTSTSPRASSRGSLHDAEVAVDQSRTRATIEPRSSNFTLVGVGRASRAARPTGPARHGGTSVRRSVGRRARAGTTIVATERSSTRSTGFGGGDRPRITFELRMPERSGLAANSVIGLRRPEDAERGRGGAG